MRAEEEYRSLILEYPDSKLVPEAKQRLRKCRKCWRNGVRHRAIYYLRFAYPAAIARLKTLWTGIRCIAARSGLYLLGNRTKARSM